MRSDARMDDNTSHVSRATDMYAGVRKRKGRQITWAEARQIALQAMELADRLLAEERDREVEYFRSLSDIE